MQLKFVDKRQPIHISNDRLPHWDQSGCVQFITFRLADSLPQNKLDEYKAEKDEWLTVHPKPWDEQQRNEYISRFIRVVDKWIDAGYGECILTRSDARSVLAEVMMHFDGQQYLLHAYVIMPNHVHALISVGQEYTAQAIAKRWKQYSARKINELTNRSGILWETSSFDHMVRNPDEYERKLRYILENPRNLPIGAFSLYIR